MRVQKRRAFLMVMALLITVILVTMGFGLLGSRVGQYQSTGKSVSAVQARAIARAGIEDVRAKLNLDVQFPPKPGPNQNRFSYTEDLLDGSNVVGFYRVTIDTQAAYLAPYYILVVTSVGHIGPRNAPTATHTYRAYIDISPIKAPPSPTYFQVVRFDDLGEGQP